MCFSVMFAFKFKFCIVSMVTVFTMSVLKYPHVIRQPSNVLLHHVSHTGEFTTFAQFIEPRGTHQKLLSRDKCGSGFWTKDSLEAHKKSKYCIV